MDDTNESQLFAAYADKDAAVELVHPETKETVLSREGMSREGTNTCISKSLKQKSKHPNEE